MIVRVNRKDNGYHTKSVHHPKRTPSRGAATLSIVRPPAVQNVITKTCPCNKKIFLKLKKNEKFQQTFFDIFLILPQNIDCGYRLESLRRPQSMFWSKNKKNR